MPDLPPRQQPPRSAPPGPYRGSRQSRGYTDDYLAKRATRLKLFPLCELCGTAWSVTTHHVIGVENDPKHEQLQACCWPCHRKADARRRNNA